VIVFYDSFFGKKKSGGVVFQKWEIRRRGRAGADDVV
jgi:hypothetical protein